MDTNSEVLIGVFEWIKYDLHGVSEDLSKLINGEAVEVEISES